MKFVALSTTVNFKQKRMDTVHNQLFHGHAIRADAPTDPADYGQDTWAHSVGDDLSQPLLLTRSGVFVPPLFVTGVALVARDDLYQRISHFPNLSFADALPHKLINLWKPIGDFSFYESTDPVIRRNVRRPDTLLDWMPNDPSLFATFPKCKELVAYNVHKPQGETGDTLRVNFVMDNHRKTDVEFECSRAVFETHPLIWSSVFFLRHDLFDLLQDAIDPNHFAVRPIDL